MSKTSKILTCKKADKLMREHIVIPKGYREIAINGFACRQDLKSIIIPDGVVRIGEYAFNECRNLTSITIPKSVTDIGDGAFEECEKLTLRCCKNGVAHTYALENNLNFVLL